MQFKKWMENDFENMFDVGEPDKIIRTETKIIPYELTLYRGFDADLASLEQDATHYYLSPKQSEQGMLWFTHILIRSHDDPIEYAKNHGNLLLTYPLKMKRHIKINHLENGKTTNALPDYFYNLVNPSKNGKFDMGLELPDGWVFSYKNEKFIGCQIKLKAPKSWIS